MRVKDMRHIRTCWCCGERMTTTNYIRSQIRHKYIRLKHWTTTISPNEVNVSSIFTSQRRRGERARERQINGDSKEWKTMQLWNQWFVWSVVMTYFGFSFRYRNHTASLWLIWIKQNFECGRIHSFAVELFRPSVHTLESHLRCPAIPTEMGNNLISVLF